MDQMIWNGCILGNQCQSIPHDPFGSVDMRAPDSIRTVFVAFNIEAQYFDCGRLPGLIETNGIENPGIGQEMSAVIVGNLTIAHDQFEVVNSFDHHYHVQNITYLRNIHYSR